MSLIPSNLPEQVCVLFTLFAASFRPIVTKDRKTFFVLDVASYYLHLTVWTNINFDVTVRGEAPRKGSGRAEAFKLRTHDFGQRPVK